MSLWGRRKSKPEFGVGIDWTYPLSNGLTLFAVINEGSGPPWDAVTGTQLPLLGSPTWTAGAAGGAFACNSSGAGAGINPLPATLRPTYSMAIVGQFRLLSTPTANAMIGGVDRDNTIHILSAYVTTTGALQVAVISTGTAISSPPTLSVGNDYIFGVSSSTSSQRLYLGGKKVATGTAGMSQPTYGAQSSIFIGQDPLYAARPECVAVGWFGVWDRDLLDAEYAEIGSGPNAICSIFAPPRSYFLFNSSGTNPYMPWIFGDQIEANGLG